MVWVGPERMGFAGAHVLEACITMLITLSEIVTRSLTKSGSWASGLY
jgi:hypothetical protein